MPDLVIENLRVSRGAGLIINDCGLTVPAGSTLAIVGRNGAGKTTLLEAMAGLLPIAGGRVRIGDVELAKKPASTIARAGAALVPEGRHLFPHMTVAEHLALGAHQERWWWRSPPARVFEAIWDVFPDLADLRKHAVGHLSGGQQQMVAVARALVSEPQLILLDEPSFGLSPRLTENMCNFLSRLASNDRTVILAEQNVDVAADVATTMTVMTNGALSPMDSVEAVMRSAEFEAAAFG